MNIVPKTDTHCEHCQTQAFLFFRVVSQDFKLEPKAMLITSGCGVLVNILMGATLHQHGHRCVLLTFEVDYCHLPLNLATNMIPRDDNHELLSHGGGSSSSHGHSHGDLEQGAVKHSQ